MKTARQERDNAVRDCRAYRFPEHRSARHRMMQKSETARTSVVRDAFPCPPDPASI